MDKQSEELIYAVMEKIQRLLDYLVKAKEAKRANGHSVQGRITMFQDPNNQMDILTGNIAILKETLERIEQISRKRYLSPNKDVEGEQPNCPSLK